jgi:aldehyde:ferredoxin oxidoreductase
MPFSRFFSHYSGQIYKVSGDLTPEMSRSEICKLFERVVGTMLQREFLICLGNALSLCAFTAVMFSEGGAGEALDDEHLLSRTLSVYGLEVHDEDLLWFAQAFWAQSIMLKVQHGWSPPHAEAFPNSVFVLLSDVLDRPPEMLRALMDDLIDVWKDQAAGIMRKYGYDVPWSVST